MSQPEGPKFDSLEEAREFLAEPDPKAVGGEADRIAAILIEIRDLLVMIAEYHLGRKVGAPVERTER